MMLNHEELIHSFCWKDIIIQYSLKVFPPGTDAILLSEYGRKLPYSRLIELGCGSGLISLLLAKSNPIAEVIGIDRNIDAIHFANSNAVLNDLSHRSKFLLYNLFEDDIAKFGLFDLVISNPPYFIDNMFRGKKYNPDHKHWSLSEMDHFSKNCYRLLNCCGSAVMISSYQYYTYWVDVMMINRLFVVEELFFKHNIDSDINLVIMKFKKTVNKYNRAVIVINS